MRKFDKILFLLILQIQSEKIAIVGGGVTGHFLAKLLREHEVTIFDHRDNECGRVQTFVFDGQEFEAGGSVLHPANKHAIRIMNDYGLKRKPLPDSVPGILGAGADGSPEWSFLPSGSPIMDQIAFLWNYGMDILVRIPNKINPIIEKLNKIYENQKDGQGYTTLVDMLEDLDLYDIAKISGEEHFLDIPQQTRDDLVSSIMTNNYSNQSLSTTNGLVTSVSMAGFGNALFSIEGGQQQLCTTIRKDLLENSNFQYKKMRIETIEEDDNGHVFLGGEMFDRVVLAGPIDVKIPSVKYPQYKMNYQSTIVTFVKGKLNSEYLKCRAEIGCPDCVLVSESGRQKFFFNSVQRLDDVYGKLTDIYHIFSEGVLNSKQILMIFETVETIAEVDWLAYPKYDNSLDLSEIKFKLTDSIYTTQPIELAASCIEMSLISAHNVANLILTDSTLPEKSVDQVKTEL